MKRKLLSILLTLCLAFSLLPTAALADGTTGCAGGEDCNHQAAIGTTHYDTLQAAFDAAVKGDTVKLLDDITLTEQVNITKALNGLTFDGNGKTITLATTTDPTQSGGSALYFGNPNASLWCTGIKIKDLTMSGTARFAIFLSGGTTTEFTNVNISGNYLYAVNLYGTHGATMTNCTISNSLNLGEDNEGGASIWSNVSSSNPLKLVNSNVGIIGINKYTSANTLEPKIYIDADSSAEIHTLDDGSVSGNKKLCVSTESTGSYTVKEYDETSSTWVEVPDVAVVIRNGREIGCATFTAAIAAAHDGDTIKLLQNCSSERVNLEDKSIVVDLNGKTLTSTAAYGVMFCAKNGEKITVNGTKEGSKLVGTLMVTSGTDGHIEINGGTYENSLYCPIYINGAVSSENSTLTVKNATITASNSSSSQDNGVGVYLAGYSTSTFENTEITAPSTGIEIRAGKLALTNCDVTGGDGTITADANGNGNTVQNAALAISQHNTKKPIDVTINGGTFTGTASVYQTDVQNTGSANVKASVKNGNFNGMVSAATDGTIEVSGGTFTSAVDSKYCAPGFEPKTNDDGTTYGVKLSDNNVAKILDAQGNTVAAYGTLAEAITAAQAGQTVKLLKSVKITEQLNINKAITLDGGDYTITRESGGSVPAEKAGILVTAGATIQNLTVSGPNTTAGSWDGGEFGIKFFNANGAKLIDSKVTGANAGVQINGGSVTMSGTIDLSGNEFGGIEVCRSGKLDVSAATLKSDNEAYNCPILWNDDTKGAIRQNAAQPLSMRASGEGKDHYYIDANKTILSQLTTDIGEKSFVVGVPTEFTFTTKANGDANKQVVGTSNFSNTAAIEKLEYYEVRDGKWYTLSGDFGPAVGFPMSDATSKFRVTFKTAGTYSFEASMKLAGTDMVLCSTSVSFTVSNPSSSSSGSSGYYVSTPSKTENGTVTVSPKNASKGDTVTITVKPDSGYVLDDLTVTDKNGNKLTLIDKGDGKYTFTMPAGRVEVKASFAKEVETSPFADVATDAYYYEAVKWAVKNGITDGVGNNLFAPGQPCTRAQIVTFLWRAAGSPEPKGTAAGMTDVVSGSYYEKAVAWAIENGVTTGTTATTFSPDATCTRAQAVTFLARALNAKAASAAEFSDVPTDSYFADAVAWAAANGVTEGVGNGLFAPDNDCTRGQIVTFLYRAYNK